MHSLHHFLSEYGYWALALMIGLEWSPGRERQETRIGYEVDVSHWLTATPSDRFPKAGGR